MVDSSDKHVNHDNLSNDLIELFGSVGDSGCPYIDQYMEKVTMYIVERDHKIFNHAYQLGKESAQV